MIGTKKLKEKAKVKATKRKVKRVEMTQTLILIISNYIMLMFGMGKTLELQSSTGEIFLCLW